MKKYVIKKLLQHPWSMSIQECLILCDADTEAPVAEIERCVWVYEGAKLSENEVVLQETYKKSKMLEVGDSVVFGDFPTIFTGVIRSIEPQEEGYIDGDDVLFIDDITIFYSLSEGVEYSGPKCKNKLRNNVKHKPYLFAEVVVSDNFVRQQFYDAITGTEMSINDTFDWFKARSNFKNERDEFRKDY